MPHICGRKQREASRTIVKFTPRQQPTRCHRQFVKAICTLSIGLITQIFGAEQCQQCTAYQAWYYNAAESIDVSFVVTEPSATTFWAYQFRDGYVGIQVRGEDESKLVLFSVWDATRAEPGDSQTWCQEFGGEGVGWSCRSETLDWQPGILYSFRIDRNGDGWRASISGAGETLELGTIWNPTLNDLGTVGTNFIEQYGFGVTCENSPEASAIFYPPQADGELASTGNGWLGACGKGFVTPYRNGAFARYGGSATDMTLLENDVVLPLLRRARIQQVVPYSLATLGSANAGFLRLINHSAVAATAELELGTANRESHSTLTLDLGAKEAVNVNVADLHFEDSDETASSYNQRINISSELDIEAYAFMPTANESFVPVTYRASGDGLNRKIRIATFNGDDEHDQLDVLHMKNSSETDAEVSIVGIDDSGDSPGTPVRLTIPSGESISLTSEDLETGDVDGLEGQLGDGTGKWRLVISSDVPVSATHWTQSDDPMSSE